MIEIDYLFVTKENNVKEIYLTILENMKFESFEIELKKTCIHFSKGSAFAGFHPKKKYLDVTIVSTKELKHPKIIKIEQLSKNRFHNDFRFSEVTDLDNEFYNYLKEAYLLKK